MLKIVRTPFFVVVIRFSGQGDHTGGQVTLGFGIPDAEQSNDTLAPGGIISTGFGLVLNAGGTVEDKKIHLRNVQKASAIETLSV